MLIDEHDSDPPRRLATHPPIDADEASALFAPLSGARCVLLAVSGGSDSIALMGLAAELTSDRTGMPPFEVATVDHGLRAGSRGEAEGVRDAATGLGLRCHILTWTGTKPETRLQERARDVRYSLLDGCARQIGATHLATAHTLDDQAETVLFRLMRGSGIPGLGGMDVATDRDGLRHLRPFLDVPKARLVATCRSRGWRFVEDPSNRDPRFARSRLRALMPGLAAEGLDAARLAALARRMRATDVALLHASHLAVRCAKVAPGLYDARIVLAQPSEVRIRALALMIAEMGQPTTRLRLDALERLADALGTAGRTGRALRRTLGCILVSFDGRDRLGIAAAPPRRPG